MIRFILLFLALTSLSPAMGETKTKLALNWKPEPQFGGFYAAQLGGHFKKNGLSVEILPGGAGTPVVQMVAAGQMDFGIVSADEVVLSRARGGDVVALFAAYQTNPQGIMVHAERAISNLKNLYESPGTLAIQKGLPYALYLAKKFPKPKVKIVPYIGGITNYLGDATYSQQCFITSEPLTAEKQGKKTNTFLIADEGYNPYTTVLITRDSVLKAQPAMVKAMVDSVRAGWRDYLDHPDATNQFMSELNKSIDLATFKESAQAQKRLIETEETKKIGLGGMTEERWRTLSTQLHDLKVVPSVPDAKGMYKQL